MPTRPALPLLVLFDIDGTLLVGENGAHCCAIIQACEDVYGVRLADGAFAAADPRGSTDQAIARRLLRNHGLGERTIDAGMAAWRKRFVTCYRYWTGAYLPETSVAAAGAAAGLAACQAAGLRLALLTGNLAEMAQIKLRQGGLLGFFEPGLGAFGSDAEDRNRLVPIARARAGRGGEPWPRERTVVVGDTPRDIACARADGVRVLAVSQESTDPAALQAADRVVPDIAAACRLLLAWQDAERD